MRSSAPTLGQHTALIQATGSLLRDAQTAQGSLGSLIPLPRCLAILLHRLCFFLRYSTTFKMRSASTSSDLLNEAGYRSLSLG